MHHMNSSVTADSQGLYFGGGLDVNKDAGEAIWLSVKWGVPHLQLVSWLRN